MAPEPHRPQAARPFLKGVAAALLGLAVAGCIPRAERPAPPPPPPTQPAEVPEEPTPAPEPVEAPRNRVAVLVPLSGENAGVGRSILNAANLALLDTGGEKIRITAYDTTPGAAQAANEALAAGEQLFLGPLLADHVRAVKPIADRADVPVVAFSNDVDVAGGGAYIIGFNPGGAIDRVIAYARAQGLERFGALVPTGTYGQRSAQAMIEAVERTGGRMVGMQSYARNAGGIRAAAERLNAQGQYDAVLVADAASYAADAAPVLRQGSPEVRILGTELWAPETGLGENPALRGAWYAAPSNTLFEQFRQRYRARYGSAPYRLATLGYDAVLLAVRMAGDWPPGEPFPEDKLLDPVGFIGVDGAFRFTRQGVADRMLEVREVRQGGEEVRDAAPRSFVE